MTSGIRRVMMVVLAFLSLLTPVWAADELALKPLIAEALKNNREVLAAEARLIAAGYRIQQAKGMPDPMLSVGYQNEGLTQYRYGDSLDAQWILSASQTFPFFGKRGLKGEMAAADADSLRAVYETVRLKTAARIKELYYDLFLNYKNIDVIGEKTALFARLEESALSRYASGTGGQQDILMAQTEKYMLREREEMFRQKIQSVEAMLGLTLGREDTTPLGRPTTIADTPLDRKVEELIKTAYEGSPEIQTKQKLLAVAEAKTRMAKRETFPDVTVTAQTNQRGGEFTSMYSLMTSLNIPIYYKWKQEPAFLEATAAFQEAKHDLEATRIMTTANIRDSYAMAAAAERLMKLYRTALVPRASQDFEAALTGYVTGKSDALTVINRLRTFLDVEILSWTQFVEKQKAMARLDALTGKKED
jgi:outer membrane protein, heavy metal efflux system